MRWNLSSRPDELSSGAAIVTSIPKSRQAWVRLLLCSCFCKRKLEAARAFDEKIVQARDIGHLELFSLSPGKRGGRGDYFSPEDTFVAA